MKNEHPSPVPDFTNACIVMFGVNVAWIFMFVWAIWGLLAVILLAWSMDQGMTWMRARSEVRAAQDRAAPKAKARW